MKTFFVSSTFRDMDEERDAIQQITLPHLNAIAHTYGESVSFCDLRWGVDTTSLESDEGSRKVLDVCLDEIDRCRPPMVVILGDRYGWLPPATLINEAARRRQLSLDNLKKSITALEIEYGALTEASCSNTLFYFREFEGDIPGYCASEDPEHLALLQELKERIRRIAPERVKTYHVRWNDGHLQGVSSFARLLAEDLACLMLPQWEQYSQLTPRKQELHTHRKYLLEKASMFYARNVFAEELVQRFRRGETRLILQDASGSGKSTFFSHLALRFEEEGYTVFPLFSGLTTGSGTAMDLLQKIVFFLEDTLGLPHSLEDHDAEAPSATTKQWRLRLNELSHICSKTEGLRILIMIDAVDQLLQDELRDSLAFVPQDLSESLRLFITCLDSFPVKDPAVCSFPPFEQKEKRDMIQAILGAHHRELSPTVVDAMSCLSQSDNPLYVSLLIQRMLMMNRTDFDRIRQLGDGMGAIIAHQMELLDSCPKELDSLCVMLLEIAGERINPRLIPQAAKLLAVSRRGLRIDDLRELLGTDFNALDFAHFVTYMSDSFILRSDGRYDFSHRNIRDGYLGICPDPRILHSQLAAYFLSQEERDPIRMTEIVYHMLCCNDSAGLIAYIEHFKTHEFPGIIRAAAATLFESSLQDASSLTALLKEADSHGAGRNFVRFILEDYLACDNGSAQDDYLVRNILGETVSLAERMQAQGIDVRLERARAIRLLTGKKCAVNSIHWDSAPLSYLLALSLLHGLTVENRSPALLMQKARTCRSLSDAYTHVSNHPRVLHYLDMAISLSREAAHQKETRSILLFLSGCYEKRAALFRLSSADPVNGHQNALANHERSLDTLRRICELWPETDNRRAFCNAWLEIGDTLTQIGGQENSSNLEKALSYFEKAHELATGLERENHDSASRSLLAKCHEMTADILAAQNRSTYADRILQNYQTALELRRQIFYEQRTPVSREHAALLFARLAEHLLLCSPSESQAQEAVTFCQSSLSLYRNSIGQNSEIGESLLQKQPDLCKAMVPVYYNLAEALHRCGREEEASAARENALKYLRLSVSDQQAYAYAEILEILRKMNPRYSQMIPYTTMQTFRNFRSRQYKPHLTASVPLSQQHTSRKTNSLVAVLTTFYWTPHPEAREELLSTFEANEKKYQRQFEGLGITALMDKAENAKKSDPHLAFCCYLRAAGLGSEEAAFLASDCYWKGTGTNIDYEKAFEMLLHQARQGSPEAASRLGRKLTVNHFYEEGLPWLLQAAGQNDGKACARLSEMYEKGNGVLPDEDAAARWRAKAEAYGGYRRRTFADRLREKREREKNDQQ